MDIFIIPFFFQTPTTREEMGFFQKFVHIDLKEYILQNGPSFADDFYMWVSLLFEIWGLCEVRDGDFGGGYHL